MLNNYFLRNEARSSQKHTFARRQWAEHLLFLFFIQHLFKSIWSLMFDAKQVFLRNEARSSQKQTFARRQWAQNLLFLFFTQHLFKSIWSVLFVVNQLFSQKWSQELSKAKFCSKTVGTAFAVFLIFFHHLSQSIWLLLFVVNQFFLRNAVRSSQKRSFARRQWVQYLLNFFLSSTSQEYCGAGIINGAIKCRLFVDNYRKTCRWVSYTFLQKPSLFNHFWIRPSFSRNFFVCKINDFGEINIWRSWWRRNVMRKKIHLLINLMRYKFLGLLCG